MAHKPKKLLWTVAGGLLTAAILGSLAASAADVNDLGAISLNRFVVTESGERVLTDSVSSDQVTQSGWYVSTDDSLYYYYADGSYATDETTLDDGNTYLFGPDGMLKTGWQTVGSKRYYYSTEVGAPEYGWVNYLDHLYYIDQENGKLTGVQEINGIPYTFDDYGCVQTGWITYDDGGTYYYDADAVPAMGWTTLDENTYYFTADGAATGIADVDGSKYSFTADGVLQTGGWITSLDGGTCYASENGALAVGMTVLDGKTYYFNENGVMQTGVVATENGTYFFNADGVQETGWKTFPSEGTKCYFAPENGAMAVGAQTIDGKNYYFDENGVMQTGWVTIDGKTVYFTEDGSRFSGGLLVIDGTTYYCNADGVRQSGWQMIDGRRYCFDADGTMMTGWISFGNGRLFLTNVGAAQGLQSVDGKLYYFSATDSSMQTGWMNINGSYYYFDEKDGAAKTGWMDVDGGKRYLTEKGSASGLYQIDGKSYYFDAKTGLMQTGWITIDGVSHHFDETTGVMTAESGYAKVQLDVPDYKQFDSRWAYKTINYSTIGQVGCLATSLAMKYSYSTGTSTTPDLMLPKLSFSGDDLLWISVPNLGYTLQDVSGTISQSVMKTIYEKLLEGKPVVVGAMKGNGSQHYVVVTGYVGSTGAQFSAANFVMNDPGSNYRTRLNEYLDLFPYLYKLIY